jgi:hypothetical protein
MSSSSVPSKTRPNDYFDLPDEARADDQYVVEKVLAKRRNRKGKWEYLLKWAGCKSLFFLFSYRTYFFLVSNDENTWELQNDIHPDLIAEFERQHAETEPSNPIYSTTGEDPPKKSRVSSTSSRTDTPPVKKKKRTSNSIVSPAPITTTEPTRKMFGVELGWPVRAVIGAAKQKDSSVLYAVDYVQGSPLLREYVPSEIAHVYIPRELIEFFQKKIVWNSSNDTK